VTPVYVLPALAVVSVEDHIVLEQERPSGFDVQLRWV